eukprot:g7581.t1
MYINMKFTSTTVIWSLALLIITWSLFTTIVEGNGEAITEILGKRADIYVGKTSQTSQTLLRKNMNMKAVMDKKKPGGKPNCRVYKCFPPPTGCSFSNNDEKNKDGCLKYPCGFELQCGDEGTFAKLSISKSNSELSAKVRECVGNKGSKECSSLCKNTNSASSFLDMMENARNLKGPKREQKQKRQQKKREQKQKRQQKKREQKQKRRQKKVEQKQKKQQKKLENA